MVQSYHCNDCQVYDGPVGRKKCAIFAVVVVIDGGITNNTNGTSIRAFRKSRYTGIHCPWDSTNQSRNLLRVPLVVPRRGSNGTVPGNSKGNATEEEFF